MYIEDVFADLPELETEHLVLRRVSMSDAEDLFDYASDPEVSRHSTWAPHRSLDDTRQYITTLVNQYKAHHVAPWGIEHKVERKLIGTCGFANWMVHHDRAEIGYALGRRYWNHGLMTEAVRAVIAFGFTQMKLNRIEARCKVENVASARVMEKAGMQFEGVLRQHMLVKGRYDDLKMYSVLRRDYRGG